MAATIAALVNETLQNPESPGANQWSLTNGHLDVETLTIAALAGNDSWPQVQWTYVTARDWPSENATFAVPAIVALVGTLSGLPSSQFEATVSGEPDEGKVTIAVSQRIGDLAPVPVANWLHRGLPGEGRLSRLVLSPPVAVLPGVTWASKAELVGIARQVATCWLAQQGWASGQIAIGESRTHLDGGTIVEEIGFDWSPLPGGSVCQNHAKVAVVLDAQNGALWGAPSSAWRILCTA